MSILQVITKHNSLAIRLMLSQRLKSQRTKRKLDSLQFFVKTSILSQVSFNSPECVRGGKIVYPMDDKLLREIPELHEIEICPLNFFAIPFRSHNMTLKKYLLKFSVICWKYGIFHILSSNFYLYPHLQLKSSILHFKEQQILNVSYIPTL